MTASRLRIRRVPGGFVVERPAFYVFDTDREQARVWAATLELAAAQHRRRPATLGTPRGQERRTDSHEMERPRASS